MASEAETAGERKRKKTLGRRKIEIKPIKCVEAKHVCFSKRREGLYKKANELCALTGAKVAVIVSSPAGKPYSFGHPSVRAVLDRYLLDPGTAAHDAFDAPPPPILREFDGQRERLCEAIAAEARRRDALDAAARAAGVWTDDVVRRADLPDLLAMLAALERVRADADRAMRQHQCAAAAAAAAAADACYYDLANIASFTADEYGGAGSSSLHHQAAAVDVAHMAFLMGGDGVSHAPQPFGPMLLPAPDDLPPPAPLAFHYGSDHSHIAGYQGHAYDPGCGSGGHGAAYEMEGWTTATCNFFG
ncbi:Agamous-like MADS-box protein AGL61 [Zea mays]|uniref:Agamous-like MADS-box protein AGL61 n=1 Tax=Zea mays TaxID=4577 RepID=A0A3L6E6F4_MAIZE|nr:Agamous-like MADS-box protein AGL61 [Zea mays]